MKRNIGTIDKTIRIILTILGVLSYFFIPMPAIYGILTLVTSATLLLTALANFCPMCAIAGISTCKITPK